MRRVLQNIELIIIGNEVYYNYNGTLYTREQFENTYFPRSDATRESDLREEIGPLININGEMCVKLQKGDYVKYCFFNEHNIEIEGEGIITRVDYNDNDDRDEDCYVVKTSNDPFESVIIHGRDIDRAWR